MIVSRIKVGVNLFAASVRCLRENSLLFLLPLIPMAILVGAPLLFLLFLVILESLGTIPSVDSAIEAISAYFSSTAVIVSFALVIVIYMFSLEVCIMHRVLPKFMQYQGIPMLMRTGLQFAFISMGTILLVMIIFLWFKHYTFYLQMIFVLFTFLLWPLFPVILNEQASFFKALPITITIARKRWAETLFGLSIFCLIYMAPNAQDDNLILNFIMLYLTLLSVILMSIFFSIVYAYHMQNNGISVED